MVAPYVGAWIETTDLDNLSFDFSSRTLRGCVDWNLTMDRQEHTRSVAPYVGAWIETIAFAQTSRKDASRTLRGCVDWNIRYTNETWRIICRTLRGCVDWNC